MGHIDHHVLILRGKNLHQGGQPIGSDLARQMPEHPEPRPEDAETAAIAGEVSHHACSFERIDNIESHCQTALGLEIQKARAVHSEDPGRPCTHERRAVTASRCARLHNDKGRAHAARRTDDPSPCRPRTRSVRGLLLATHTHERRDHAHLTSTGSNRKSAGANGETCGARVLPAGPITTSGGLPAVPRRQASRAPRGARHRTSAAPHPHEADTGWIGCSVVDELERAGESSGRSPMQFPKTYSARPESVPSTRTRTRSLAFSMGVTTPGSE